METNYPVLDWINHPHYILEKSNFNFKYVRLCDLDILFRLLWVCTVCQLPFLWNLQTKIINISNPSHKHFSYMWYVFIHSVWKISHVWKCIHTTDLFKSSGIFLDKGGVLPEGGCLSLLKDVYWFDLWYLLVNAGNIEVAMNLNVNCVVLIFYHNWKLKTNTGVKLLLTRRFLYIFSYFSTKPYFVGASNEYPQHMISSNNKKTIYPIRTLI